MKSHRLPSIVIAAVFITSPTFAYDCAVTARGANGWNENESLGAILPQGSKFRFIPDGPGFIDHDGALASRWAGGEPSRVVNSRLLADASTLPLRRYAPTCPRTRSISKPPTSCFRRLAAGRSSRAPASSA